MMVTLFCVACVEARLLTRNHKFNLLTTMHVVRLKKVPGATHITLQFLFLIITNICRKSSKSITKERLIGVIYERPVVL